MISMVWCRTSMGSAWSRSRSLALGGRVNSIASWTAWEPTKYAGAQSGGKSSGPSLVDALVMGRARAFWVQ